MNGYFNAEVALNIGGPGARQGLRFTSCAEAVKPVEFQSTLKRSKEMQLEGSKEQLEM